MFAEHKEALEVTEAPTKTLKLSEALRIGARLRPQCRDVFFINRKSCALGAAYEAITGRYDEHLMIEALIEIWPHINGGLAAKIASLNDLGKTREYIADWLEAHGF